MYLRHSVRRKDGKTHVYWRLVRSVRRNGKVVQETVAQLGELDAKGRAKAKALAQSDHRPEAISGTYSRTPRARRPRRRCDSIACAWNAVAPSARSGSDGGCGKPCGWMRGARSIFHAAGSRCRGPRWPPCSSSHDCVSPRVSCTSRRTGTDGRLSRDVLRSCWRIASTTIDSIEPWIKPACRIRRRSSSTW